MNKGPPKFDNECEVGGVASYTPTTKQLNKNEPMLKLVILTDLGLF
jgi:hypothetical protein